MDFPTVLKKLLGAFEQLHSRYALIGGFALSLWGLPRATVDLGFLLEQQDHPRVHALMTSLGYSCRYQSINVSQYVSELHFWGAVDFLHAFRQASRGMLKRAVPKELFGGSLTIQVAQVEDLIGLKIQAMVNDPSRRLQDLTDIENLLAIHGKRLDWDPLAEYFGLFHYDDLLSRLRQTYGSSD